MYILDAKYRLWDGDWNVECLTDERKRRGALEGLGEKERKKRPVQCCCAALGRFTLALHKRSRASILNVMNN